MTRQLDRDDLARHYDRLYRAAVAMCYSPDDAEDLVQETLARVLARERRVHQRDEIGYLLVALRNTYISEYRSRARRPHIVEWPVEVDTASHADVDPHRRARTREVLDHVRTLRDGMGAAIMAVDVLGLSTREAAQKLDVEQRTLERRLRRARTTIARRLALEAASVRAGAAASPASSAPWSMPTLDP